MRIVAGRETAEEVEQSLGGKGRDALRGKRFSKGGAVRRFILRLADYLLPLLSLFSVSLIFSLLLSFFPVDRGLDIVRVQIVANETTHSGLSFITSY